MAHGNAAGARTAMREMQVAVEAMGPLLDAHFADKGHAFPPEK